MKIVISLSRYGVVALLVITCCLTSHAQQLPFSIPAGADSLQIQQKVQTLAQQVLPLYRNAEREVYFDNRFRLEMAAAQFGPAVATLDSLRNLYKQSDSIGYKVIGFQFEAYSKARLIQQAREIPFEIAFKSTFNNLYSLLSEKASANVSAYFEVDVVPLKKRVEDLLAKQAGKDSISLADAQILCRAYNSWIVYSKVTEPGKLLLAQLDNTKFIIEDSVLITTHDGSAIAATVIRKKDITGKQPAIFIFNIYTGGVDKSRAKDAANNGYVGIVANTRGKRLSPQIIEPFEHDAEDAYDIIDWISKQSWSNGKIGMYGGSYLGFSQWASVKKLHPALKTIVPQVAVGIGIDYPMSNNVFMSYMLRWIHYVTNSKQTDEADFGNNKHWDSTFKNWYTSGRAFRALDTIEGRPNVIFQRWLQHPSHDSYWQRMVPYKQDFANINIPILTTTGYFDDDQLGALYYFREYHKYNTHPNHYLLIGPYSHGGGQSVASSTLLGYTIDSVANISITDLTYKWFNYILKDSARPALLQDKINYQTMGSNKWNHKPSLSAINNDTLTFYLSAVRTGSFYKLETKLPAATEYIHQEINMADRTDTAETPDFHIEDSIISDKGKMTFISAPFSSAFTINGSFFGNLYAQLNKKDMDITIDLYELQPNGKYFVLSSYLGRASYAKDRSKRQLLIPGKINEIPIHDYNTFFTSRHIQAGSRLVMVFGINKNAAWQINYGSGKDVSDETISDAGEPMNIKWWNKSFIKVPVWQGRL